MASPQRNAGLFGGTRAAQLKEAGRRASLLPTTGSVDHAEIDHRIRQVQQDLRDGVAGARLVGAPEAAIGAGPGAAGRWVGRVWPHGEWDDKRSKHRSERQGNFSYGATAAALGIPESAAIVGAGLLQRAQAVGDALSGRKVRARSSLFSPSHGDEPRDTPVIREGYAYGLRRREAR